MTLRILLAAAIVWSSTALRPLEGTDPAITTAELGELMTSLSEPEGYFDTDNFISNEAAYLRVLPALHRLGGHGGAYVGVGPDQNYSYIAELDPRLAVIVDIRRQNSLQHLYFKALFERSATRGEYLQRLFGRRLEPAAGRPSIPDLLDRIEASPRDPDFSARKLAEARETIRAWKLPLSAADLRAIDYVACAFFDGGPGLKFTSFNRGPRSHHPTLRQLLEETDGAGRRANYLADDVRFERVRRLHAQNRIVPVVGDFAGPQAFARVARELRRRGLEVRCFYASNVEFYLFGDARWGHYIRNLRLLPLARDATIIRSYASMWQQPHPAQVPGYYMTTVLQPFGAFLANEGAGRNATYWDIVARDCILK